MADGTTYEIDVVAEGMGTDATADEILQLSDAIEAAEQVLTPFDSALSAASARMDEAAAAADAANAALAEAEGEYKRLERASTRAAKAVERAAAKGRDTSGLQAAATAAAAAVQRQAAAVDRARASATSAAAAQKRLAAAYQTVSRRASQAARSTQQTQASFGQLFQAAGALGGPLGGLAGRIAGIGDGLRGGGGKAGLILGAFAVANAFAYLIKITIGLGVALVGAAAGMLLFAIQSNKAVKEGLEKRFEKAKKNITKLFDGVRVDKLVKPMGKLLQLFDQNTSAGKGLAKIIETVMNPLIDGLVEGMPLIKEFFKGMILGALRAIIVVLRLRNAIAKAIPKDVREKIKNFVNDLLSLGSAARVGEGAFKALALILAIALVPLVLLGVAIIAFGVAAWAIVGTIENIVQSFADLGQAVSDAYDEIKEIDIGEAFSEWADAGLQAAKDLGQGIIDGITEIAGNVAEAAKNMASDAVNAIKATLNIKSPSKLLRDMFEKDVGGAVVLGLEAATPKVRKAGEEMGEASAEGTESGAMTPAGGRPMLSRDSSSKKTVHLHFGERSIVIETNGDDESATKFRELLTALIEGTALQLGGGEVTEGAGA